MFTLLLLACVSTIILFTAVGVESSITDGSWCVSYVKPSVGEDCPPDFKPCYPLQYFVSNSNFHSNSTFIFLKGLHILQGVVQIRNVTNLALIGVTASPEDYYIQCKGPGGLFIGPMIPGDLTIANLMFSNCGNQTAVNLSYCGALIFDVVLHLNLTNVVVQNSTGYGLLGYNLLGNSFITNSVFKHNRATQDCVGGNALVYYNHCPNLNITTSLTIDSSQFLFGHADATLGTGGLSFIFSCINILFHGTNLKLYGNERGNLLIRFFLFTNISISLENSYLGAGWAPKGAGALVKVDESLPLNDKDSCHHHSMLFQTHHELIHFSNVTFHKNIAMTTGGGFQIEDHVPVRQYSCVIQLVVIENCEFRENILNQPWYGGGVAVRLCTNAYSIAVYDAKTKQNFQTEFRNTTFEGNKIISNVDESSAIVQIEAYMNTTFTNCTFIRNTNASTIRAYQTDITLQGNNTFRDNRGYFGTGLALLMNSFLYLKPHTNILFSNNHAHVVGGAIFTDMELIIPGSTLPCFFQVLAEGEEGDALQTIRVEFDNNTADIAGSSLYGGYVDQCHGFGENYRIGLIVFRKIFHYNYSDPSVISSDPIRVCFCTGTSSLQPDCEKGKYQVGVYPGELFNLAVVLVGQANGTVPGVVHSSFDVETSASLGNLQNSQKIDEASCTSLYFSVSSTRGSESLVLRAEKAQFLNFPSFYRTIRVVVSLHQCPPAFVLSTTSAKCNCVPILAQHNAKCYINNQTILRPPMTWVGYYEHNGTDHIATNSGVLFHQHCHFHYCDDDWSYITINNTDAQCVFNHSGILCGRCKPGLSLTLGSSLCQQCSDWYLALLAAFVGAGIALVIFLICCNITVTEGNVSGLIFYANIVRMNHTIFFPAHESNILTVFVAWINLDLGIQSCFYHGMDGYVMTWLQFAFPLYIWAIIIFIIILSRRYHIVARLVGKNAVKVLATLLLLSYTKLQRTLITVFSFTYINYPDNVQRSVWLYDGNVDYLKGKHAFLSVVAAVFMVVLLLPYTFVLLFIQTLQAKSEWKALFWVDKLKPLFDAYTGPYLDRYRFWTGFLLLVRSILLLIFAFNTLGEPRLNLLVITLASLSLAALFGALHPVYQKRYCNILELSFYLNLGALAAATEYMTRNGGNLAAVTYTSTSIAFTTFAGTVFFHIYQKAAVQHVLMIVQQWSVTSCCRQEIREGSEEPLLQDEYEENSEQAQDQVAQPMPQFCRFNQPREPVLEYT